LKDEIETLRKQLMGIGVGPSAGPAGGAGIDANAEREKIRAEIELERAAEARCLIQHCSQRESTCNAF
jgi:hypothetical protein